MRMQHLARLAATTLFTLPAHANPIINGGGTDTAAALLGALVSKHNAGSGCVSHPPGGSGRRVACTAFGPYISGGTAPGQNAILLDDFTCDTNAVTGAHGGACAGPAGAPGNTADYAFTDFGYTQTQANSWTTASLGQSAAGNLVQFPLLGAGLGIVVNNAAITANGAATLSDSDLCGIFSGRINNTAQIADSAVPLAPGPLSVVVRSDAAGTTLWLTGHLAAVCPVGAGIVFTPTTSLASLFPNGLPPNFIQASGANAAAADLAGCGAAGRLGNAMGYLSPDLTTLAPNALSQIVCASGAAENSPLIVAGLIRSGAAATLPTVANTTAGLSHPVQGINLTPPSTLPASANPLNWAPLVQTVSAGYPIVGYALFTGAQCYGAHVVGTTLRSLIGDVSNAAAYKTVITDNGLVPLQAAAGGAYASAVRATFLSNRSGLGLDIDDRQACGGLAGR